MSSELAIFIREPTRERTLLLARSPDGLVHVREWDTSAGEIAAAERTMTAAEIETLVQEAYDERYVMRPGVAEVRAWLERER